MDDITGFIICLAIAIAIVLVVVRKETPKTANESKPSNDSPKPLFRIILFGLFLLTGLVSIFILLGGPDGKIGSKEATINGLVGLGFSALFGLIYRRIS